MIYFKEDYVTVEYDEELKFVSVEWHGLVLSYHYRETLEMVLDLVQENQVKYFLINRKLMGRISLADEKWRKENWYPRFMQTSIIRSASVISQDFYNEVSISKLIEEQADELKIERRSFCDQEAALDWLLQPEETEIQKVYAYPKNLIRTYTYFSPAKQYRSRG